ncbi:AzlC family ABC transporter permease [Neoactinobaculum massilliense]|uniref:AzlC family ABC transporter permease n=1 Tax=Neoactinobaculum massilliense TaxID=2364794 RepID=UPI000F545B02|nr:AzlC family ABC transporter permease [Neoactinobaculum massilliense]
MHTTDTRAELRAAARDALPVMLGYVPLGMGLGMTVVGAGLDWWWAPVFGLVVYAGSMEFLLVPMVVAHVPLASIALAALLIQFRHVFYGISFPLERVKRGPGRLYAIHSLTDEVYALVSARPRESITGPWLLWVQGLCHAAWVSGCALGAAVGLAIPIDQRILSFLLTALFVVLMMDAYRANPSRIETIVGACVAAAALIVPRQFFLPVALSALTLVLVIMGTTTKRGHPSPPRPDLDGMP